MCHRFSRIYKCKRDYCHYHLSVYIIYFQGVRLPHGVLALFTSSSNDWKIEGTSSLLLRDWDDFTPHFRPFLHIPWFADLSNGCWELHWLHRLHSPRTFWQTGCAAGALCALSACLQHHCDRHLEMVWLITMDPRLHSPMYYFLSNLSFCDVCYCSTVFPKMLADFLFEQKMIPYNLCAIQMFLFGAFADVECLLLAVMAYDRYVAICNPLLYTVTMSRSICTQLVAIAYLVGLVDSAIHTCCTFRLLFWNSNIINHFFCDIPPLLALSSSDTSINEMVMFTFIGCVVGFSVITICFSYSYIITTILRMNSAEGRRKTFSTCASHLTAVAIFHGTLLFMYFRPSSSYSMDTDKTASVFYTVVIPMLNPLIYSLRNKDVKGALKKPINTKLRSGWTSVFTPKYLLKDYQR